MSVNNPILVKIGQSNLICVRTYIHLSHYLAIYNAVSTVKIWKKYLTWKKQCSISLSYVTNNKNKTLFVRGQDVRNLRLSFPKCRFHIHHCNMSQWSKSIHTVNDCKCDLTLSDPHNFTSYSVLLWYSVWVSLTSLITSKRFKKLSQTLNSSCPNWSDFVCCFGFIDWSRSTWILSKHGYVATDVCSAASSSMLNAGLFGSTVSCTPCPISLLQRFKRSLLWKMSVFCFLTQIPSHKATINITW